MKVKFTDAHKYPHGYMPSHATDIRERFERMKREARANAKEAAEKVQPINAAKTGNDRATVATGDAPAFGGTKTKRTAHG